MGSRLTQAAATKMTHMQPIYDYCKQMPAALICFCVHMERLIFLLTITRRSLCNTTGSKTMDHDTHHKASTYNELWEQLADRL